MNVSFKGSEVTIEGETIFERDWLEENFNEFQHFNYRLEVNSDSFGTSLKFRRKD